MRPSKYYRLSFVDKNLKAFIGLYGDPNEVRVAASDTAFLSVREDGVTFSPGIGNNVNLQALPGNLRYGGMVSDLQFPLSLIPSTMATPMPKQVIVPPMEELMSTLKELSALSGMLVGF